MLSDKEFSDLIARVRRGEQTAANELIRLYEPEIRRAARLRLTDSRLRRIVDSIDISQSVFGRFFRGAIDQDIDSTDAPANGSPQASSLRSIQSPGELISLLVTMTRNRVIDEHRRQSSQKRGGQLEVFEAFADEIIQNGSGPETTAEQKELLHEIRGRLSESELAIADLRHAGKSWSEVSEELDESAEVLRKRLQRALDRVKTQLNSL